VFRATGSGQYDVLFDASTANIMEALLYNFDFDDFDGHKFRHLKTEHSKFLPERVVPLLESRKGNIWIQGSASRIGSADWNMTLSQVREGQVQAFLLDNGVSPDQIRVDAVVAPQ
jgi:outer membrane protein OmpA-like peptidoglycan-associated protein